MKRLDEFGGDISKFTVVKLYPSKLRQIAIAKTEPGDENNQDISALVGKVDIRRLEHYGQNDADAYSYSGGLNRTTQGLLEGSGIELEDAGEHELKGLAGKRRVYRVMSGTTA